MSAVMTLQELTPAWTHPALDSAGNALRSQCFYLTIYFTPATCNSSFYILLHPPMYNLIVLNIFSSTLRITVIGVIIFSFTFKHIFESSGKGSPFYLPMFLLFPSSVFFRETPGSHLLAFLFCSEKRTPFRHSVRIGWLATNSLS